MAEETYRDLPLYQYIAGLGASGVAPIRVEFDAPEVIQADSILNIELQVDNDLEGPLQVRLNTKEYPGWDPQSGAVLWIQTSGIKAITEWPAAFLVEPASSRRIRLAEHFVATDPGFHPWRGYLDLPSSKGSHSS